MDLLNDADVRFSILIVKSSGLMQRAHTQTLSSIVPRGESPCLLAPSVHGLYPFHTHFPLGDRCDGGHRWPNKEIIR